ncbi:hypothetical protein E4U61_000771 [Claviceps capensis]|nr:hypothetical protein E4U61_000771 [Claviceps capensis]
MARIECRKWLESSVETAIVQLGYLGLLLLVYEGGLSTCLKLLRANVWMSMALAVNGISIPIGLSFVLMRLTNATPSQCFTAGASLSSTSLGTTFTVLGTSGLTRSRLGVILTTAAMMDDVVGLVLVQVISNLGKEGASITASIFIRPSITNKMRRAASAKKSVTNPTPQTSLSLTCAADNSSRTGSPVKTQAEDAGENYNGNGTAASNGQGGRDATTQATPKPRSLYATSIIGCAMVARGEIGFLISSITEKAALLTYLIVTWPIVLCTILGPLALGLLVRRVRRLQKHVKREGQTVSRDVLGVWRIS